jgi:phage-related protein
MMKELHFVGTALDDLRDFPMEARREAGFELGLVQRGYMPSDFKPMLNVGAGAYEIRIHVLGEWRVIQWYLCTTRLSKENKQNSAYRY